MAQFLNRPQSDLWPQGWGSLLHKVRVGVCPGLEPGEWLRCFVSPEVVVCAGGLHSTLLLVQDLQKWQFGFFGLFVQNLPQLFMHAIIFSPIQFLYSVV